MFITMKNTETAGKRLALLRVKTGLEKNEFCTKSGISYSLLTKIESDIMPASTKVLKKIADKFGDVAANWIETGTGEVEIQPEREIIDPSMMVQHVEFLQEQLALMSAIIAKLTGVSKPGKNTALDLTGLLSNNHLRAAR